MCRGGHDRDLVHKTATRAPFRTPNSDLYSGIRKIARLTPIMNRSPVRDRVEAQS
jgi:hypothetical protein